MSNTAEFSDHKFLDTLHLSDTQWRKLAQKLRCEREQSVDVDRRCHQRYPYVERIGIAIRQTRDHWTRFIVLTRDISSLGLGFVHGGYLHLGSDCRIILSAADKEILCVTGVIGRCQHLRGVIHDVGVEFDGAIDVNWFITPDGADPQ